VSIAQDAFSLTEKVKSLLSGSVSTVSTDEVRKWKNVQILDAREKEEFDVSHLPNAVYVGDKTFKLSTVDEFSRNDTLIVYCTVGYRSEKVAEKLKAAGFKNVYNLFGGIFSWKNNGGKVIDANGKATDRVHCYDQAWSIFLTNGEKVY
jgi:rhodanese-related sulfurtransferase